MVRAKRIALTALMISLGVVTYVLESVVPFPIPNGKWGFSNFVVLLSIFAFGDRKSTRLNSVTPISRMPSSA
ncbi:MAG TPA: hypothetical protein DEA58_03615 [Pseudothermotoga sp.]|nr:hypothetical protein [Pseudothermotoga sp.]